MATGHGRRATARDEYRVCENRSKGMNELSHTIDGSADDASRLSCLLLWPLPVARCPLTAAELLP